MNLIKRTAIVTGGTRGMGVAITETFLKKGMSVLAVYHARDDEAIKAKDTLAKFGDIHILKADVSKKIEAENAVAVAADLFGRIDVLVNNAGIFDFAYLEEMDEAFFDRIMNTNLKSAIFMIQAVIPYMKRNHYGRIANATSISGQLADVGLTAYACSKAALNLLTKVTSGELAPYGITVNAYAPGIIHTEMTDSMIRERGELQLKQIPAGYFGKPEEVGSLLGFLCSEEASYITGEIIGIDGGMMKVQNPYRAYEFVKEFNKEE